MKKKRNRPGNRHVSPKVTVYIPAPLLRELDAWIKKQAHERNRGQVIRDAIRAFLRDN